jgi:hypothetical protein
MLATGFSLFAVLLVFSYFLLNLSNLGAYRLYPSGVDPASTSPPSSPPRKLREPAKKNHPVVENFPLAAHISSPSDLPPVPSWNIPPTTHIPQTTPLFIGFTRNWPILQQTVVSYIAAGWPPSDIYVVENTGTMSFNRKNLLTLQNPFYLDYNRLTKGFGVNVLSTPTLLSFAQLQNFYLSFAEGKGWDHYFWGHMDVVAMSDEAYKDEKTGEYKTLYQRAVEDLGRVSAPGFEEKWAIRFYSYDRLALVNLHAFMDVGGWDPMIGYYLTDCDHHERLFMKKYTLKEVSIGMVYDIGSTLDDLLVLYRRKPAVSGKWGDEDTAVSDQWKNLTSTLDGMQRWKNENEMGRNFWQGQQQGGQGEPFYVDSRGFEEAIQMWIANGKAIYAEKWGHRDCNLREVGLGFNDAWQMAHDW